MLVLRAAACLCEEQEGEFTWEHRGADNWLAGTLSDTEAGGESLGLASETGTATLHPTVLTGKIENIDNDRFEISANDVEVYIACLNNRSIWTGYHTLRGYFTFDLAGIRSVENAHIRLNQIFSHGIDISPIHVDDVDYGGELDESDWDPAVLAGDFANIPFGSGWHEIDVTERMRAGIDEDRERLQFRIRMTGEDTCGNGEVKDAMYDANPRGESGSYLEYTYSGYRAAGSFVSTSYDAGIEVSWDIISWEETLPPGTRISLQTRTASSAGQIDETAWSGEYTYQIS